MANPYANGYGGFDAPAGTPSARPTDDYDPYGAGTYGTPPSPRDRRLPARNGGYGGLGDYSANGSAHAVQPVASRQAAGGYGYDEYSSRPEDQAPPRSPRRVRMPDPRPRQDPGHGDIGRSADPRRRGDRQYTNGNGNDAGSATPPSRIRGAARGNPRTQIEDVLQHIQSDWPFMTQDKCIPVQVALQLMDSSSLGRADQYDQFQETNRELQRSLRAIVNEHHQGFNSSIGTFHKIQSGIQASQARVRTLKESLIQSKGSLSTSRPELKGLAAQSQNYDEMLQALSRIEQLRLVTDKLEARISEKRFLTAVDVLQDALRMVRKPEMDNIGALSDLRIYLANQETSLTDILIEELHSHLYLKSPYCQDRWKAHAKKQSNGESSHGKESEDEATAVQPLYQFLDELDVSQPMVEDASRNPEADSFYYIQLLVESLNKSGHLEIAVNSIEQRMPVELFRVVDKTNNEVDQRHPLSLRGSPRNLQGGVDFATEEDDPRQAVIFDLLWTLYAKFEAIAEGHRVLHDVLAGIVKREGSRNSTALTGSFKELWKLYQNEIRSLLHDYLATDGNIYRTDQSAEADGRVSRRNQRDKHKKLFKMDDMDRKSVAMTNELNDLESILKASVPGLVSGSRSSTGNITHENTQQTDGAATGHKLLIEPSVFNMGLLLPPSLEFLQSLKDIVPPGSDIVISTLTSFLDDLLVNVFYPQLEETLVDMSSRIFVELDAFQQDPQWNQAAKRPIFKGTAAFFNLITAFCRMLSTIPYDQAFSQLIITQMVSYYEKCYEWYITLVSRSHDDTSLASALKTSAALAVGPGDIHDVLQKLWTAGSASDPELLQKEAGLLIIHTNESPLVPSDLIWDQKMIGSLCLFYTSMQWLSRKISELRHITSSDAEDSRRNTRTGSTSRWALLNDPSRAADGKEPVYLVMTQETVAQFDAIVTQYQELAGTVLLTLHVEIRLQTLYSLALALSPQLAPYLLPQPVNDPDPRILSLNAALISYDETIAMYLRDQETSFIRTGLALLIDTNLVTSAGSVKVMNANGCGRMRLNILVLQQNLKNVEISFAGLDRAAGYFALFMQGPSEVVKFAKAGNNSKYSYEELKTLVELCYSEQLGNPERGISTHATRAMGDHLLQLSEYMWQS